MRPVTLRVKGLHSFREAQVLDFRAVTASGLFGVFGPTGAGKSTLLDAVTLALYGQVDRASHGTQGILNQLEDSLEVAFAFELRGAEGPQAYRVERRLTRAKDGALRSATCRLLELGPPERVLADATQQVSQAVIGLLGLTADDFTRAVVLPQGKFAEFLHLPGSRRREMLQRLFGLERYGEDLTQRLSAALEALTPELVGIEREQSGLGDASPAALQAAVRAADAAAAQAAAADAQLTEARARWQEWDAVWRWQADLLAVEDREAAHAAEGAAVQAAREELAAAERAEAIRPYVEAVAAAEAEAGQAAAQVPVAAAMREAADEARREAEDAVTAAVARRREAQPQLLARRTELEQAAALELDLSPLQAEAATREPVLHVAQHACDEAERRLQAAQGRLQGLHAAQQADTRTLQTAAVPSAVRARVHEAVEALRGHRLALAALEASGANRDLALSRATAARQEASAAAAAANQAEAARREAAATRSGQEDAAPDRESNLAEAARQLERWRAAADGLRAADGRYRGAEARRARDALEAERASDSLRQARTALATARAAAEEAAAAETAARERLRQAEVRQHAALLSGSLRPGEPCPVCGSTHHPTPARPAPDIDGFAREADAATRHVEQARQALATAIGAAAGAETGAERALTQLHESEQAVGVAEAEIAAARALLPAAWHADGLANHLSAAEHDLARRRQALEGWAALVQALRQVETAETERMVTAQQAAAALAARAAQAEGVLAEREAAVREAAGARAAASARLEEARDGLADEEIEDREHALAESDRLAQEVSARLADRMAAIAAAEAERAAAEAGHGQVLQRRDQARQALEEVRARVQALAMRLQAITGGEPAAGLLAEVDAALQGLDEAERRAQTMLAAAASRASDAATAEATARQQAAATGLRLSHAAQRLATELVGHGFADRERAVGAALTAAERDALQGRITRHDEEGSHLRGERQRIAALLAGRALDEAAWHGHRAALDRAAHEAGLTIEALGAARHALEDITARHARWRELETHRVHLSKERDTHLELQATLRGSAFVEFLAEEQLTAVAQHASERLGRLTRGRYALEVSPQEGFLVRDDFNGGVRRLVTSLSGGETFVTSLALALALSTQVQLRGRYPLEFFFLDEGFGSLDPEALDTVMDALERLRDERLTIGVISHLPEVRARMPRRVVVEPAEPGGAGSRLRIEMA